MGVRDYLNFKFADVDNQLEQFVGDNLILKLPEDDNQLEQFFMGVLMDDIRVQVRVYHPKKVIFNPPATIVFWKDGEKTVVKCQNGENFDKEKGFAMCFMKKILGNKGNFNNFVKKYVNEDEDLPKWKKKENKQKA